MTTYADLVSLSRAGRRNSRKQENSNPARISERMRAWKTRALLTAAEMVQRHWITNLRIRRDPSFPSKHVGGRKHTVLVSIVWIRVGRSLCEGRISR